MKEFKCNLCF